ncbi:hypothetical protein J7M22_06150 [Candidatus Poribacteria bacterium]|nr:hypothetical protein [Candidatus Poribacteria bacterium]
MFRIEHAQTGLPGIIGKVDEVAMLKRGGYIPMCDHGVPDNVSFENYVYYRKRICKLDH